MAGQHDALGVRCPAGERAPPCCGTCCGTSGALSKSAAIGAVLSPSSEWIVNRFRQSLLGGFDETSCPPLGGVGSLGHFAKGAIHDEEAGGHLPALHGRTAEVARLELGRAQGKPWPDPLSVLAADLAAAGTRRTPACAGHDALRLDVCCPLRTPSRRGRRDCRWAARNATVSLHGYLLLLDSRSPPV